MTCIKKEHIQDLKNDLKANGFSLASLHKFKTDSESRVKYLEQFFNNTAEAEYFNNKYEKYLLEKQKTSLREWAKKGTKKGITADSTKTLIEKIDALKKVLKPSDKPILNGLVKQKLGFVVTPEYAKGIYDTYNTYKNNLAAVMKNRPDYMTMDGDKANEILTEQIKEGKGDVYDLAMSLVALKQAYQDAKIAADTKEASTTWLKRRVSNIKKFAGFLKSTKATFDISAPRQLSAAFVTGSGLGAAAWKGYKFGLNVGKRGITDPEFAQNIIDMYVLTRPNSLNGMYRKLGIDVGMKEEAFPESFFSKMSETDKETAGTLRQIASVVGETSDKVGVHLFKASEVAYSGAIQMARASMADILIKEYDNDLGAMKADGLGDFVNQLTGRGKVHLKWNGDTQDLINVLFFAPKFLAARIRTITDLQYSAKYLSGTGTKIEQLRGKAALRNALFYVLMPMLIKAIMRAMDPEDEHGDDAWERFISAFDPRTTEFGKWRVGDTRVDMSFGLASLYTLVARGVTRKSISSKGAMKDTTWGDVLSAFLEGKMSPALHTVENVRSMAFGDSKDFMGRPLTVSGMFMDAVSPISIQQIYEAYENWNHVESPTAMAASIALDIVGISSNTYEPSTRDLGKSRDFMHEEERLAWNVNRPTSDINPAKNSSIMTKLSGKKQEKAIEDFKTLYNKRVTALIKTPAYKRLSDEGKADALKKVRTEVNNDVKKKYNLK